MTNVVSWLIELAVKPNTFEELRTLTRDMVDETRTEAGAVIYERYFSDDHTMHFYERYIDSASAIEHLRKI